MNDKVTIELMKATVSPIAKMLQNRMNNRIEALKAFEPSVMDNMSEEVKKMREIEGSRLRAVIQEQRDLLDILNSMFPNA